MTLKNTSLQQHVQQEFIILHFNQMMKLTKKPTN
jgi:hypothetical protein